MCVEFTKLTFSLSRSVSKCFNSFRLLSNAFRLISLVLSHRKSEHATRADQPMFQHLVHCEKFLETLSLYKLPDIDTGANVVDLLAHISTIVY